ncbi:lytic transglycosylase domain-containing protein [Denitrobaculum tricleocarpae]|uniref:Lytic transglycosylase domain-containing protein n=1 Tax=Denitrobaculum tricleocarpae TaxID=2591009 RepID=A0A545U205_9PROT|nr:lytic transglycosylase domain-containing protein [Denitrobaculum tricleocarpae]TQV83510.1 lytic transglycosylase domain-containing protein [Denitrobaculum tricleocarpae]
MNPCVSTLRRAGVAAGSFLAKGKSVPIAALLVFGAPLISPDSSLSSAPQALAAERLEGHAAKQPVVQTAAAAKQAPIPAKAQTAPKVLSETDAQLYRDIFALQKAGKWRKADKKIARLGDQRLMGHLLAQRYLHPTAYRSKYKELSAWLKAYADHPQAPRLYKLALKRRPKNYRMPTRPEIRKAGPRIAEASVTTAKPKKRFYKLPSKKLSKANRRAANSLKRQIHRNALRTRLSVTEKLLSGKKAKRLLHRAEIDDGYSKIAAAWFYYGNDQRAYNLASSAAARSRKYVPIADWIAGLAAWRLGDLEKAGEHFARLATAERASGWNKASGAYWAARVSLKLRKPAEMSHWLNIAARYPRTFYGLLARGALGLNLEFTSHLTEIDSTELEKLQSIPEGARALALAQVGRWSDAQDELLRLVKANDPNLTDELLTLSELVGMPNLAYKLGSQLARRQPSGMDNDTIDAALYPIPPWSPQGGFKLDRALIYAVMRQESSFNPRAKSPDGARGLLQLMPATAGYIAKQSFRGKRKRQLYEPTLNMKLGQSYIRYLLKHNFVQGDLFRLTTAYNGGPGNLNKWQRKMEFNDDPLLFIESLPSRETRLFVERVLANLWIYRTRLGQATPSLEAIAAGDWPQYESLDNNRTRVASSGGDPRSGR